MLIKRAPLPLVQPAAAVSDLVDRSPCISGADARACKRAGIEPCTGSDLAPTLVELAPCEAPRSAISVISPRSSLLSDGALLGEQSGTVWAIFGNAKWRVPDPATRRRFFSESEPELVPADFIDRIRRVPDDGTLFGDERGTLWAICGGARFRVPDSATYARLFGARACHRIWDSALSDMPAIPADGTLLREESCPQVYVILGGAKEKVRAHVDPPNVLWAGALSHIP